MEAIWVAAEMRAGGAYAHSALALDTIAHNQARKRNPQVSLNSRGAHHVSFPVFFLASLFLTAAAWAQPVTFGASVQLTGPVANTGRYYKDAYEFAVEKINAAGGIKIGSAHQKIALKILDNQSDVNLSVRQYVATAVAGQGELPAGTFRQQFRAGGFVDCGKEPGADGAGRRRIGPDLQPRLSNTSSARCRRRAIISAARSRR